MPEKDMAGNESSPFTFVIRHRHRHSILVLECGGGRRMVSTLVATSIVRQTSAQP